METPVLAQKKNQIAPRAKEAPMRAKTAWTALLLTEVGGMEPAAGLLEVVVAAASRETSRSWTDCGNSGRDGDGDGSAERLKILLLFASAEGGMFRASRSGRVREERYSARSTSESEERESSSNEDSEMSSTIEIGAIFAEYETIRFDGCLLMLDSE